MTKARSKLKEWVRWSSEPYRFLLSGFGGASWNRTSDLSIISAAL